MDFAGKVAIVTGASRGFGRAVAIALGRHGCELALAARSADQLVATADEIQKQGRQAIAVTTDVTRESDVAVLVERTRAVFGRIDILVNAAHCSGGSATEDCDPDQWQTLVATNLTGPFLTIRTLIPIMKQQGDGKILNLMPGDRGTPQATMRNALAGLTKALADELADDAIQVNAIHTGRDTAPTDLADTALFLLRSAARQISGQVLDIG